MNVMSRRLELGARDRRRPAEQIRRPDTAISPQITRHTMPSSFASKSLKTNDRHPDYSTHFFKARIAGFFAFSILNRGQQGPHAA
jgi:hypothetical protein